MLKKSVHTNAPAGFVAFGSYACGSAHSAEHYAFVFLPALPKDICPRAPAGFAPRDSVRLTIGGRRLRERSRDLNGERDHVVYFFRV